MNKIILTSIIIILASFCYGQEIASFSSTNDADCSGVTSNDINISTTGICRGSGINYKPGTNYNSRDWGLNTSLTTNDYIEWSITPNIGYEINLSSMDLSYSRSPQGPTITEVQVDSGSGFITVFTDLSVADTSENNNIDLTTFTALLGTITFRLFGYNADSTNGTLSIDEHTSTNKGIIINGVVSQTCSSTSTWNGTSWSPSAPDLSSLAIINGNYNTSSNGSFTACSLEVNASFRLTVDNATYVEIVSDVIVDGQLYVETHGNFVQNNDTGTFTVNSGGVALVNKSTSIINNWYDYTYWSSPVTNETIGSALFTSNRSYWYNTANFIDALAEIDNTGVYNAGQDGFDDDGDDWQATNASDTMTPGIGYAATHTQIGLFPGVSYQYTFSGPFNNGVIQVPVFRNDSETADDNFNLIGNPYPSAISADDFFTSNLYNASTNPSGSLEGAIYLWSHNTSPSNTAIGNQPYNFSEADYAIINGAGETAGSDGNIPNRFIPSGQSFFISYSNSGNVINTVGNVNEGIVTFNNAMRQADATSNSQFFKSTKTKKETANKQDNKFWINLTSDNGVFYQIVVAYVNGATDGDDGSFYDAVRNLSSKSTSSFYTLIKGKKNKKFAIQGKNPNNLNSKETVALGFYTSITQPTIYKLSIAKFQGEFISNNNIYLKDKLLHKFHDLSNSDYVFTSEEGAFNKRFEIVFDKKESLNNNLNKNFVSIITLEDNKVNFKTSDDLIIKNVSIYDALVGKRLYQFKGFSHSETFNITTKVNNSIYIAKIELSNGVIITKKVIIK